MSIALPNVVKYDSMPDQGEDYYVNTKNKDSSHSNCLCSLYAVLSVCCIVATSDGRKKSEMEVSADWCVAIEHQRLSLIRVIFVDYQTSKLQCDYESYIQ